MIYISDETIDKLIKEDVPYIDLTTLILGIDDEQGMIQFFSRDRAVICGTEEVSRLFKKLGITTIHLLKSGTLVEPGSVFFEAQGPANLIHFGWKVSQNILEYCSGIATRTQKLVTKAKSVNPATEIVTTRKIFPGTKELSIKAVLAGGGFPHRLGLSETVLVFKQHLNFLGSIEQFIQQFNSIKTKSCEKKIIVEVENGEDALKLCSIGVDGIQFDKIAPGELKNIVASVRSLSPKITLIGTGGINADNVCEYAVTGVDAIATTSVYYGKPVDIGAKIAKI